MSSNSIHVYEMSFNVKIAWQAHSMSNSGSGGTNRLLPRRQLLANGTDTDAYSGNIHKHHHAALLAEYLEAENQTLCEACRRRDSRRAAAISDNIPIEQILGCGICDTHGFLVPTKKGVNGDVERSGRTKHSLLEFSFALALPDHYSESSQLFTRTGDNDGDGQMIMKVSARSGEYALCIRYKCAGIGYDTNAWRQVVHYDAVRLIRYQSLLRALRDLLLSPTGALTSKMLPHLTGLTGVITYRTGAGRAPMYSPLQMDFVDQIGAIAATMGAVTLPFSDAKGFSTTMEDLIANTAPWSLRSSQVAVNGVANASE